MSVCRVEKSKNYTVMSNHHLKNKNLTLKAKGLLSVVLSLPDDWDYSVSGLVAILKENRTAIDSALKELKEEGYLEVTKVMPGLSNTGRIKYIYDFYEEPKQEDKKQDTENLYVENLVIENNEQLNTNKQNTKNKILKNTKKNLAKNENQSYVKKTKKEKSMDKILARMEEYDFSEKVQEKILDYFSDRLDANDYPQSNYLEMQLTKLSAYKESEQLQAIDKAIQGQWKSMLYGLEKSNFKSRSGFVDTASRNITQEQREQERIEKEIFKEKLKNNDSSLHTF